MSKLAIEGGTPVRSALLPYGRQSIDNDDIEAVVHALRADLITTGPLIGSFEAAFAEKVGARHAVAVCNGTAALHAAAMAAGIGRGDEVIVPPMTFVATANCVRYLNGTVIFADIRPDTLTLDPAKVKKAITSRTKAIITVDYAGQPSDLDDLMDIARANHLMMIEDASHALGATYRSRPVGCLADMTTFSLHPVKHVTTGEGGVITTDSPDLAAKLRLFRTHGITSDHIARSQSGSWYYEMVLLGYNYRLTDFQCALGLSQLRKLDRWLARRREIAAAYTRAFGNVSEVEPLTVLGDRNPAWHLYVVRLKLDRLRVSRSEIFEALRAENIGVNVHYIPVHWHPYYRSLGYKAGGWPVSEHEYERLLTLPMFPAMNDVDVQQVIDAVAKVVTHYSKVAALKGS